jgi:hypothetical protein
MGRPTVRFIGERKGYLEVLEVIPQNTKGRHVQVKVKCHKCGSVTEKSSVVFNKSKSCGCDRQNPGEGKVMGAKTMPWQLPSGEAARRLLISRYKRSAKKKGVAFTLTDEELSVLFKSPCRYCGRAETHTCKGLGKSSGDYSYVGIDRIDTFEGYTPENTTPCCWTCNMMKNTLSEEDFLEHIRLIYKWVEVKV